MGTTFGGTELRGARKLRGLTQGELARILGCSQGRVSMLETGRVPIRPRDTVRLATAFYPERVKSCG